MVDAVARSTNSIGYAGLDATYERGSLNRTHPGCGVKIAGLINRAGVVVQPSVASAQAAVRASSLNMLYDSSCPGFGLCGEVIDGGDQDVWPLTAVTVSPILFASTIRLCTINSTGLYRTECTYSLGSAKIRARPLASSKCLSGQVTLRVRSLPQLDAFYCAGREALRRIAL